jgi:2-haloacid dehalogenase
MSLEDIKALTFDAGGTVLDWHTGFTDALTKAGAKYGLEKDWSELANGLRRRSPRLTVNMGEHSPPERNHDDSHRIVLDEIISENGLDVFTDEDRHLISWQTPHNLEVWPDFPVVLPKSRERPEWSPVITST